MSTESELAVPFRLEKLEKESKLAAVAEPENEVFVKIIVLLASSLKSAVLAS
tara:strand:+ start:333 stop:488 length:156 start_codon:yes stop_codon:yes gene_type:complete